MPVLLAALLLTQSPAPSEVPRRTAGRVTVEAAIPAEATFALYLRRVDPGLGRSLELLARLFGAELAEAFLAEAPLPLLAVRTVENGRASGLDPAGGLGLFRAPAFDGLVGVVAVHDGRRATAAVRELLEASGARRLARPDRLLSLRTTSGVACTVLVARGHLYLFMADEPGPLGGRDEPDPAALARSLRSDGARFAARASEEAQDAELFLYAARPFSTDSDVQTVWLSAALRDGDVRLKGFVAVDGGTWPAAGEPAAPPPPVSRGPTAQALIGAPVPRLVALLAGNPGTARRAELARMLALLGVELEPLVALFPSTLAARAWTAEGAGRERLALVAEAPTPAGTQSMESLETLLARTRPYQRLGRGDGPTLLTSVAGHPVALRADGGRLRVVAGHVPRDAAPLPEVRTGHVHLSLELTSAARRWAGRAPWFGPDTAEPGGWDAPLPYRSAWLEASPAPGGLRLEGALEQGERVDADPLAERPEKRDPR